MCVLIKNKHSIRPIKLNITVKLDCHASDLIAVLWPVSRKSVEGQGWGFYKADNVVSDLSTVDLSPSSVESGGAGGNGLRRSRRFPPLGNSNTIQVSE